MNETVHKFLITGDTFMPKMHLKQAGFTTLLVVHLLKTKI